MYIGRYGIPLDSPTVDHHSRGHDFQERCYSPSHKPIRHSDRFREQPVRWGRNKSLGPRSKCLEISGFAVDVGPRCSFFSISLVFANNNPDLRIYYFHFERT